MSDHHPWVERVACRLPRTSRGLVAVAALTFGVAGGLLALAIVSLWAVPTLFGSPTGDVGTAVASVGLALAAGLGAAVAGAPLWWLLVERRGEVSLLRGGLVGVGVGVLAHPLMWAFAGLGGSALVLASQGTRAFVGASAGSVLGLVGGLALVSVLGLLVTGIVTVPVAAATGVALAHLRDCAEDLAPPRQRRHV